MTKNTIKILHCADLHLGTDIASFGEKSSDRARENFRSFEKIIQICDEQKVDFLLIAGDLFDKVRVPPHIAQGVINLLSTIPQTSVVISPGNHDPYSVDSSYHMDKWPANTHIFTDKLSYMIFEDKKTCVWGCAFRTAHASNLWAGDFAVDPELINICVMHGDLASTVQGSGYNPIPNDFINRCGFDYIALGHVHKRSIIGMIGNTRYAYSGCPDGRGFDELGELGVYTGNIGHGICQLDFVRINSREILEFTFNITEFTTNTALASEILHIIKEKFGAESASNIYDITISGKVSNASLIDSRGISELLNAQLYFARVTNHITNLVDYESISYEKTLKGLFVRNILDSMKSSADGESEVLAKALEYGYKAFEGEVAADDFDKN